MKICLYNINIILTVTYANEMQKITASINHKLDMFHQQFLCKILHVSYCDQVTNDEILCRANPLNLWDIVAERRMHLARHLPCPQKHHCPKITMELIPLGGKQRWGGPKITSQSILKKDLQCVHIRWKEAKNTAGDRMRWKKLAA